MSFINQALLWGLGLISIPIILHLLNRRSAKQIEWGAMQFLLDSIESRKRRIQLEEALLLAARCLLVGLVALAVARPLQSPEGKIPYVVVIPALLLGVVCITTGIILRGEKKWFWSLLLTGVALFVVGGLAILYEHLWNLKRFGNKSGRDIVLIIDGSTSMQLKQNGMSNFDRAINEAKEIVDKSMGNAFSVILGGPTPVVKIGDPIVNKNDIDIALNSLRPVRGKMDAFGCLTTALTALNRGSNANKEIIVFTDGQAIGWNLENKSSWEALQASSEQLTTKPSIIQRRFALPKTFRNLAVGDLKLSRDVVGTDRPVSIEVTVENTGSEAVTPVGLELVIGAEPDLPGGAAATDSSKPTPPADSPNAPKIFRESSLGQIQPGVKETFRFLYKFPAAGSVVLRAKVQVQDELPLDDTAEMVAHVVDKLDVLIVEGNPTADVLKRAATFTALALAPTKELSRQPNSQSQESNPNEKAKPGVLLDPEVMPLTRVVNVPSFSEYDVVILCDVPRLPDSAARRLAAWVQAGGGLLIAPGAQADANFYNNWRGPEGALFLPAKLHGEVIAPPGKDPTGVALNTFTHAALKLVADAKQSDLGGAVFQRYWKLDSDAPGYEGSYVGGRLVTGDSFLTIRKNGFGTVMMASASFDAGSGNLATRQAFVPLVHQIVYHLASPGGQPLHLQPAQQINISLSSSNLEGGLKGEYFKGRDFQEPPMLVRIDPKTEAKFDDYAPAPGLPRDNFSVRWTGAVIPRFTDEYIFDGWADDKMQVWLEDKRVINHGGEARVRLEAGKFYPIRIDFEEGNSNANYQLYWRTNNASMQQREIIPTGSLTPFPPGSEEKEVNLGRLEVLGPDQQPRQAQIVFTRSGLVARLGGGITPGVYRMKLAADRRQEYASLVAKDGTIPFSIADDTNESRLVEISDQDREFIRKHFTLLEPTDAKDISNILAGREFGEELWKYLAIGALFILLAEIALTRWIALNRRSGEEVTLNFEQKFQAPKQFQEQLEKVKKATALN